MIKAKSVTKHDQSNKITSFSKTPKQLNFCKTLNVGDYTQTLRILYFARNLFIRNQVTDTPKTQDIFATTICIVVISLKGYFLSFS